MTRMAVVSLRVHWVVCCGTARCPWASKSGERREYRIRKDGVSVARGSISVEYRVRWSPRTRVHYTQYSFVFLVHLSKNLTCL